MNKIKQFCCAISYLSLSMCIWVPMANSGSLKGQAQFTGSVYSTTCSIYLPQKNQAIDFGLVGASTLARTHLIKDVFSIQLNECQQFLAKGLIKIKFNGPLFNDSVESFRLGEKNNRIKLSILLDDIVILPNQFNTLKPIYFNNSWDESLPKYNYIFTFVLEAQDGSLAQLGNYNSYLTFNISYE
ncbi:fimbrial protein [Providencia rettgeri]|nr:type 1 fimbrial protein [Providencia rettgeri]